MIAVLLFTYSKILKNCRRVEEELSVSLGLALPLKHCHCTRPKAPTACARPWASPGSVGGSWRSYVAEMFQSKLMELVSAAFGAIKKMRKKRRDVVVGLTGKRKLAVMWEHYQERKWWESCRATSYRNLESHCVNINQTHSNTEPKPSEHEPLAKDSNHFKSLEFRQTGQAPFKPGDLTGESQCAWWPCGVLCSACPGCVARPVDGGGLHRPLKGHCLGGRVWNL